MPLSLESPSHFPPFPTPLDYIAPVWIPVWKYSKFPFAIYFIDVSMYASMLLSPFISSSWGEVFIVNIALVPDLSNGLPVKLI